MWELRHCEIWYILNVYKARASSVIELTISFQKFASRPTCVYLDYFMTNPSTTRGTYLKSGQSHMWTNHPKDISTRNDSRELNSHCILQDCTCMHACNCTHFTLHICIFFLAKDHPLFFYSEKITMTKKIQKNKEKPQQHRVEPIFVLEAKREKKKKTLQRSLLTLFTHQRFGGQSI